MSLASEMNATVTNILAARETRKKALHNIHSDTEQILTDAKAMMSNFKKESGRRKGQVNEFLKSSTKNRMDDFKAMMKAIEGGLKDIKDSVTDIKIAAKKMLSHYHEDRKEAAKFWASLSKHSKISREEEEEGVVMKKRKIRR